MNFPFLKREMNNNNLQEIADGAFDELKLATL